jgi:hypothetical protein
MDSGQSGKEKIHNRQFEHDAREKGQAEEALSERL